MSKPRHGRKRYNRKPKAQKSSCIDTGVKLTPSNESQFTQTMARAQNVVSKFVGEKLEDQKRKEIIRYILSDNSSIYHIAKRSEKYGDGENPMWVSLCNNVLAFEREIYPCWLNGGIKPILTDSIPGTRRLCKTCKKNQ
jgi:hypothetical protein